MNFPNDAGLVGEVGLGVLSGIGPEVALEPRCRVRPGRAEIIANAVKLAETL